MPPGDDTKTDPGAKTELEPAATETDGDTEVAPQPLGNARRAGAAAQLAEPEDQASLDETTVESQERARPPGGGRSRRNVWLGVGIGLLAVAAVAGVVVAFSGGGSKTISAGTKSAPAPASIPTPVETPPVETTELGAHITIADNNRPSSCTGASECVVSNKDTEYPEAVGDKREPMRVPTNGTIISWSIQLGQVSGERIHSYSAGEGGEPKARISILRSVSGGDASSYQLVAQSPLENLRAHLGRRAVFYLSAAIAVNAGDIVALTTPTWVPAYHSSESSTSVSDAPHAACYGSIVPKTNYALMSVGATAAFTCKPAGVPTYTATFRSSP
jgi:hypothetical protein